MCRMLSSLYLSNIECVTFSDVHFGTPTFQRHRSHVSQKCITLKKTDLVNTKFILVVLNVTIYELFFFTQ